MFIGSNSVFANDEDDEARLFELAPTSLDVPNWEFESERANLFNKTKKIPPNELYPLIFSDAGLIFIPLIYRNTRSYKDEKDYQDTIFRELIRLSEELFSETMQL